MSSYAESDNVTGNGPLSSSANINFMIKIPATMSVRIGSQSTQNAQQGQLSARVFGNSGTVLLSASTNNEVEAKNIRVIKNADTQISNAESGPITYTAAMP